MAKRATKVQRNFIKMKIGTPLQIPMGSRNGVKFQFSTDTDVLGEIQITGANIYVRKKNEKKWHHYPIADFLDKLT